MNKVVLDASALLAVLRRERGGETVASVLDHAVISTVNYSEILKKAIEKGAALEATISIIKDLELTLVPFDERLAMDAAALFPRTSHLGLSFADRACLALAKELNCPLYTADRRLADSPGVTKVILIRGK